MMDLTGWHLLITGSARGIGAAVARLAKERGAKVVLHGRTMSDALTALQGELEADAIHFDVRDRAAAHQAVAAYIAKNGPLDALVNAAGIVRPKPFLDLVSDDFEDEFATNIQGTIYCSQAVLPTMVANKAGRIVNVSSIRGTTTMTSARGVIYSMSKAAVSNLTAAMAKEFAPSVCINCVAPGFTETDMARTWNDAVWQQAASNLLKRPAKPHEIAEAILFLASPAASFITGQTLLCDGGYEISGK